MRAAATDDGFAALSYAQLADEIAAEIAAREALLDEERGFFARATTPELLGVSVAKAA
jgi:hypothetical protein